MTAYLPEQIARVVHAANAELQKIELDPAPSLPWDAEADEIRESAVAGVRAVLAGATPEQLHEEWCRVKAGQGWVHGPEKNAQLKTHPCLVCYEKLPENQQVKDAVFAAIVQAMSGGPDLTATAGLTPGQTLRDALAAAGWTVPLWAFMPAAERGQLEAAAGIVLAATPRLQLARCEEHPGQVHAQFYGGSERNCLRGLADLAEAIGPPTAAGVLRAEVVQHEFSGWLAAQGFNPDPAYICEGDRMAAAFEGGMDAQAALAARLIVAAAQPAPELEAAFASGMRVRTALCDAHGREHFQVRTNGHWLCGHLLAGMLIAQGIVAYQEPQPAPAHQLDPGCSVCAKVGGPHGVQPAPDLTGDEPFSVRDRLNARDRARYDWAADQLGPSGELPLADVAEGIWRTAARQAQPASETPYVDALFAAMNTRLTAAERQCDSLRELLDEVGVLAANAPEDGDSFAVCEQIAMRIAAVDVPDTTPIEEWPDQGGLPELGQQPAETPEDAEYRRTGDPE